MGIVYLKIILVQVEFLFSDDMQGCGYSTFCFFAAPFAFSSKNPVKRSLSGQVQQVARQPIAAATNIYFKKVGCSCNGKACYRKAVMLLAVHQPFVRAATVSFQPASFNRSLVVSLHHVRPSQFAAGLGILPQRTNPNKAGCTIPFASLCFTHRVSFLSLVAYSFQQGSVHLLPSLCTRQPPHLGFIPPWAAKVLLHSSDAY